MKAYYKNNLKQAFLILEGEENLEEDFRIFMLQENEIPGLLKTNIKYIDDMSHYHYDISGKTSLQATHEKTKLKGEDIKRLVKAFMHTMKEIQKYMLDGKGILLEPEYIYCEGEDYFFCYYPPCQLELKETFHTLTEFFVREVDYKDKEGVRLAYTLHKASMEENYSIEKIMDEVLDENPKTVVRYDERMEERIEENIEIAEKKELWEPVRRLLERKKKEKWESWDEKRTEEENL